MSTGWDCHSSLYDSFELKSFNIQLASAIAASDRSISMPHTSKSYHLQRKKTNTATSRISKSIHRLIGTVFGVNSPPEDRSIDGDEVDEYFLVDGYLCEGCLLDTIVEEEGEKEEEVVAVGKKRADVGAKLNWKVKPTPLERWFARRRVGMCRDFSNWVDLLSGEKGGNERGRVVWSRSTSH